jgi:3-oxoacyl-[acyl-carrier-protein] synthase-3
MSNFRLNNVKIAGISTCVPKSKILNKENKKFTSEEIDKFIESTGVVSRRVSENQLCTSDYSLIAANKLISDLNWKKEEIKILIFVSQTADFKLPITASILQNKLDLPKSTIAFDIPLGCSGYVYGLSVISSLLNSTKISKGLLIVGDTITKTVSERDKSISMLFGDAFSVTALEYNSNAKEMIFSLGTDGSGADSIKIPVGGSRNKFKPNSLDVREYDNGIFRNDTQLSLDGMDVFTFGISRVPKLINELISFANISKDDIDFYILHQANHFMNEKIRKKLLIEEYKFPYSIKEFGNTSGASIPLTISSQLKNLANYKKMIFCGFGVGLSWGAAYIELENTLISDLIEI